MILENLVTCLGLYPKDAYVVIDPVQPNQLLVFKAADTLGIIRIQEKEENDTQTTTS